MKFHKPSDMEMNSFVGYYVALAKELLWHLEETKSAFMVLLYHCFKVVVVLFMLITGPVFWPIVYVLYCIFQSPEKVAKRKEEIRKRHDADV